MSISKKISTKIKKYYFLKLKCVHGGIHSVLTTNNNEPQQPLSSTMKQNCPAFIYLRVTSDKCSVKKY
ncbi:FAR1 domain-containing protein [Aphis craccivora]|uniref:FAR1 domain-containing protein n=1 Tax=Aphis craccivora TaxID=307492 RepID=A0A6G0YPG0_APHCR|nr:FAR1 domain-containing protein [Aphis craccivora]